MLKLKLWRMVFCFLFIASFSCDQADENEDDGFGVKSISTDHDACFVVSSILDGVIENNVLDSVDNGTFSSLVIYGSQGGSATITGSESYKSNESTSCISSTYSADLTLLVFKSYRVMSADNTIATLNGTLEYSQYYYSQQCGLSYSSSSSVSGASITPIKVSLIVKDDILGEWGYADIIEFSASGDSSYCSDLEGWCTGKNGYFSID